MDRFVLGFIAGEGSFHVTLELTGSGYVVPKPTFSLRVYEDNILDKIRNHTSVGKVRDRKNGKAWRAQSISDCKELSDWVDKRAGDMFKSTDKWRQFKLWKEAVEIKLSDGRSSLEEKKRLIEISYEIPKSDTKSKTMDEWFALIGGN